MALLRRSAAAALVTVVTSAALVTVAAGAHPGAPPGGTRSVDVAPTSNVRILMIVPGQMAVDTQGFRYVTESVNQLNVYAPDATGTAGNEARPVRVIGGISTKLYLPCGVAVDRAGFLYVGSIIGANPVGHPELEGQAGMITVYAPGATGNATPVRTIVGDGTGLDAPCDLALHRGRIYAANIGNASVTVHRADADGNAAPERVIAGPSTGLSEGEAPDFDGQVPRSVAVARNGTVYVGTSNQATDRGTVAVFARGADGDVAPRRTLDGATLGFDDVNDLALDRRGNLYVANGVEPSGNVQVFRKGARADRPASVKLGGPVSQIELPRSIHVFKDGSLLVLTTRPWQALNTYAPLVRGTHAHHGRHHVKGHHGKQGKHGKHHAKGHRHHRR